jgi:hypothetical protein
MTASRLNTARRIEVDMIRKVVAVVLLSLTASVLPAQEASSWFVGAGLGAVHQDRHDNGLLHSNGDFYQVHGGWGWTRHVGGRIDLVHASIPFNDDIAFLECDGSLSECPAGFLGPVKVTSPASLRESSG